MPVSFIGHLSRCSVGAPASSLRQAVASFASSSSSSSSSPSPILSKTSRRACSFSTSPFNYTSTLRQGLRSVVPSRPTGCSSYASVPPSSSSPGRPTTTRPPPATVTTTASKGPVTHVLSKGPAEDPRVSDPQSKKVLATVPDPDRSSQAAYVPPADATPVDLHHTQTTQFKRPWEVELYDCKPVGETTTKAWLDEREKMTIPRKDVWNEVCFPDVRGTHIGLRQIPFNNKAFLPNFRSYTRAITVTSIVYGGLAYAANYDFQFNEENSAVFASQFLLFAAFAPIFARNRYDAARAGSKGTLTVLAGQFYVRFTNWTTMLFFDKRFYTMFTSIIGNPGNFDPIPMIGFLVLFLYITWNYMVTVDNKLDAELDLPISNSAFSQALAFAFGCAAFCALFEKTFHVMFTSPRLAKVVQAALTQPRQWFVNARQPSYLFQPKGRAKPMLVIRPKSEPFDSVQTGSGLGLYQFCAALGAVAMIDNVDEGYLALGSFFIPLGWLALELTRTFKGTLYLPAPYGPIPGMLFGLFYAFFGEGIWRWCRDNSWRPEPVSEEGKARLALLQAEKEAATKLTEDQATGAADRAAAKELYAKWAEERAAGGSGGGEKKEAPTWRDAIANGRRERAERLAREKEEKEARKREAAAAALAAGRRG